MRYNLVITPAFEREVKPLLKKYNSLKNDLSLLFESLEKDPFQGKPIGQGCYKIRMAITSKGKGKSGGARIITCVKITSEKIFLLTIFDKTVKNSISEKELTNLLKYF